MNIYSTLTVADKIALTLEGLMRAVAACSNPRRPGGPLAAWLIRLIWTRVSRTHQRIQGLLKRFQEGRLRVSSGTPAESKVRARTGGRRGGAVKGVPQHRAWLLPLVPCEAANFAAQLRLWLAEPEMVALLVASPQARLVLAPLCRMLGIEASLLTPKPGAPEEVAPQVLAAEAAAQAEYERAWNLGVVRHGFAGRPPPGDRGWRRAQAP
jgi:hypothetical protein